MTEIDQAERLRIPGELEIHLRNSDIEGFLSGGSGSVTLIASRGRDRRFVKYVARRSNAIDGHEADRLLTKARQVQLIRRIAPEFGTYVPVVRAARLPHGCVLESQFVEGSSPIDILLSGDVPGFSTVLTQILDVLGSLAYNRRASEPISPSAPYVDRLSRRLDYVASSQGFAAFAQPPDTQGGDGFADVTNLALDIGASRGLLPTRLFFPAHGDLNLFNVIVRPDRSGFALVDQRGTVDDWDPVYDLGKILLSVWLQAALELGLHTGDSPEVRRRRQLLSCGAEVVRDCVDSWNFRSALGVDRKQLWLRVVFAAAVHAMCESAARISVACSPACTDAEREYEKAAVYLSCGRLLLLQLRSSREPVLPWPWDRA